jgi:hypothetical protein
MVTEVGNHPHHGNTGHTLELGRSGIEKRLVAAELVEDEAANEAALVLRQQ